MGDKIMKKEVRIALYIVSIVCVILLGAAMIYAAHHGGSIRQKDSRQTAATAGNQSLLHYVPLYKKNGVRGNGIEWERCDNGIFR